MGQRKRGGGNERMILVRSVNDEEDKIQCDNVEESYIREEFHIVDLKRNKIYCDCLPPLPRACWSGDMVATGHSIFIFGGLGSSHEESSLFKFVKSHTQSHFHMGASRLHFDPADGLMVRGGEVWAPAPMNNTPHSYIFTYLNGDVYSFGNICFAPEVLHVGTTDSQEYGPWKSLPFPPELADCQPDLPLIPDPTKNRILVHFDGGQLPSPSLYAFYPPTRHNQDDGDTGTWRCLDSNFSGWNKVVDAALLDGVLFLHGRKFPNLVRAYEVATRKWLDVQWSTRVIEKKFSVDDCCFEFDSLFCLDDTNKILCLAVYSPLSSVEGAPHDSPSKTTLLFFKFRAERRDSTISLTPLYTRSYEIVSATTVLDFLLL